MNPAGRQLPLCIFFALLAACTGTAATDGDAISQSGDEAGIELVTVASGLDKPWGMDFLPDGRLLVTEKSGRLLAVDTGSGEARAVRGMPESAEVGQGGLLDVLVSPSFTEDGLVYFSYAISGGGGYTTRVARARLREESLSGLEVLFTASPYYDRKQHFGSRLLIHEGHLYASIGDRGRRHGAQDLGTHNGTVIRIYPDGRVPADNPFVDRPGALPEIWTWGHRNPQGMALHPHDGTIWVSEHGPRGGDELNRLEKGANYGWPVITYGEEYRSGKIGEGTHKAGMEQPLKQYTPSIATGGIDFYTGERYPGWGDSVLVSALALTHLNRVELEDDGLGREYRLFTEKKLRFRDVQQGPDGYIYVLAGGDSVLKLVPARSGD